MSTMKFLTSRASFLLSSSCSSFSATHFPLYILQVSHFSSAANYATPYYSNFRRQDEESRSVRVSVWWDFENCNLPAGVNIFKVSSSIIAAVRANGIKGPVHITAFGDMLQLSRAKQEALSSTGVNLTHIPHGGKNSADRSLLLDLMYWVSQNPPPAHLYLISGDRDFASVLHRLRMSNYNILLASPESVPGVLCSAASIMWHWHDLLKGNNLSGKHFNQPPDGPHGSWYGHYKLPLEKPVLVSEQQSSSQNNELPEPNSDFKLRPIPKVVVRKIRQILNDHPKGLSILDLRSEMGKSNLTVDKDLYGYQKFSRFLLAMPDILRLQSKGDGHFMVYSATSKAPVLSECNSYVSEPVSNYEDQDTYVPSTSSSADSSDNGGVERNFPFPTSPEKSSITPSTDLNAKKAVVEDHHSPLMANKPDVDLSTSLNKKVINVTNEQDVNVASGLESTSHSSSITVQCSSSEVGFMKSIWRKWFAANGGGPENENHQDQEKKCTFQDGYEKKVPFETNIASSSVSNKEESSSNSTAPVVDSAPLSSSLLSSYDSALHNKDALSEGCTGKDNKSLSYFSKIKNWCKFWVSTPRSEETSDHSDKIPPSIGGSGDSVKHELFSDNLFWSEMESFMNKHKGSRLFSMSRTRGQIAHNLQNEGPLSLRSLSENDMLLLVDLLISKKRWVVECPSQIIPFKLASSFIKNSCLGGMQSQSDTQRSSEHDREANFENPQHTEVKLVSDKNPLSRSRREVLANCQKLLKEILKEHPEGYNISLFKNLFIERYGYQLDYQKLGYRKLTDLLQIMPRVKIESGFITPKDKAPDSLTFENVVSGKEDKINNMASNSDGESSDPSSRDDDSDSLWEDLGPLVSIRSKKSELKLLPTKTASERQRDFTYEPSLSDDELSDSEEERLPISEAEVQKKTIVDKGESTLLQILDSWHGSKEIDIIKVKSENVDGTVDRSKAKSKLSDSSVTGGMNEASLVNMGRRQRPQKSYNFVSDPVTDNDDLVDEIFGILEKPIFSIIRQAEVISTIEEETKKQEGLDAEEEDEDALEERRRRIKEKLRQREQEEIPLLPSEDEEEEEESEYETDSEEELTGVAMVKPVFVPKSERDTVAERERLEAEERAIEEIKKKKLEDRKRETKQILVEEIRRDEEIQRSLDQEVDIVDIDTDDEANEAEEYETWKAREIARIKRDRESREAMLKVREEIEKLRNMTEEERREWERKNPKPSAGRPKQKWRFMQKYFHKGAFFQSGADDAAATMRSDEIFHRDFSAPTGEDKMDKSILPKVMQVKHFGRSGRTKWTHLVNEDTTDWNNP